MESEDTSRAVRLLIATAYPLNIKENDGEESLSPPSTSRSQYGSTDEDCCSLLTIGVSKALGPSMLAVQARGCKVLLELGMGTGRVALQSFLECTCLERVVGVEIQGGRFAAAERAIGRLVSANPARFHLESSSNPHGFQSVVLHDDKRTLEMWCGDVLAVPTEEIRLADAIIAQMSPESSQKHHDMQALLNNAKDGCRLLSGKDLSSVWQLDAACCWHACQPENKEAGEDKPWIPGGYKTFLFEAHSSMPPSIFKSKNSESSGSIQCILVILFVILLMLVIFPALPVFAASR